MHQTRRAFLGTAGAACITGLTSLTATGAQRGGQPAMRSINMRDLTVGYEESGRKDGFPVILLHGFPDDVRAWDGVISPLSDAGYRILVPYLRGFGATRLRSASIPRMAEQAAIGQDLIDFTGALGIARFAVAGYDWGGRAACVAAALHPERVRAAVLIGGYTIQDTIAPPKPQPPAVERAHWYQWYFNTPRGRIALETNRRALCRFLWKEWSPTWNFSDEIFQRTAASFDSPDFVDLVIHSYRHRNSNAAGDPRFAAAERQLSRFPKIHAPSIVLRGADDGVNPPPADLSADSSHFTSLKDTRIVAAAGHFVPREKPDAVAQALIQLLAATS